MAISKQAGRRTKHAVLSGDERISLPLTGVAAQNPSQTTYVAEITGPTQKFTVQSNGTLAFTYDVSANGSTYSGSPVSVAAGVMSTYSGPHVVASILITWVSGSGVVTILAV